MGCKVHPTQFQFGAEIYTILLLFFFFCAAPADAARCSSSRTYVVTKANMCLAISVVSLSHVCVSCSCQHHQFVFDGGKREKKVAKAKKIVAHSAELIFLPISCYYFSLAYRKVPTSYHSLYRSIPLFSSCGRAIDAKLSWKFMKIIIWVQRRDRLSEPQHRGTGNGASAASGVENKWEITPLFEVKWIFQSGWFDEISRWMPLKIRMHHVSKLFSWLVSVNPITVVFS